MPLPSITYRDLVRAMRRDGWYLSRRGGRHDIYAHVTKGGIVPVLRHPTQIVKRGTLSSILDQAGLTEDDLRRLL